MSPLLLLKDRPVWDNSLTLPLTPLLNIFDMDDEAQARAALWQLFERVREQAAAGQIQTRVHDVVWLRQIILWKPKEGGVKPRDRAPWFQLGKLLNEIGEPDGEVSVRLTDYQARLLADRLASEAFEFPAVAAALDEFLLELMVVLDRPFSVDRQSEAYQPAGLENGVAHGA